MKYLSIPFILLIITSWKPINNNDQFYVRDGFTLSYNEAHEQPNWIHYTLKPSDIDCVNKVKRKNNFKKDKGIRTGSATKNDYKNSGFDRGHLKPSADESCSRKQMDETFLMCNMSPQLPSFNRGIWKRLEMYVRSLTETNDSIQVFTGGVLSAGLPTIGENEVTVPDYFFKILYIYNEDQVNMVSYLLPNKKITGGFEHYIVDIKIIEQRTGFDFPD